MLSSAPNESRGCRNELIAARLCLGPMSLTPAFLDELRARTSLSALIQKTVKLQRAGREMRGCCPFHNEKTPSFYVNDDKGFYHCFGCSAHGDAIKWMTDQRGLPFIDAVKELAASAGLDMPEQDRRSAEKAERAKGLHDITQAANDWFQTQLTGLDGSAAQALLRKRGITEATARAFGLGYAPESRAKLRTALKSFGDDPLVETGLLIQVEGKEPYDRFRGRLTIPIRDPRGRVIAWGARIIGEGEPKYLNSPDTPLFDKGRTLYNLDRAVPAARKANRILVVEGYMDVIALAQAGIAEVVAPLGTSITETQLERLWRIAPVPILCLDGDSAGQKAGVRAAHRALPVLAPGQSLAFASLPAGKDPDDLVRSSGPEPFEEVIKTARPLMRVVYDAEKSSLETSTPEGRAGLRSSILKLADSIQNGLVQSEYKRSFNDLFFEDFGWKRAERRVIGESVLATGPHGRPDVLRTLERSTMYGLARFPAVLALTLELVSQLEISQEQLLPWRATMVEAIIKTPDLDDDALKSILIASKLKPQSRHDIQVDLRFPWDVEPAQAVRTLGGLIEFLHEEQMLLREIAEVQARVHGNMDQAEYLALDQERSALYARKLALYDSAYQLGGGDDDAEMG